MILFIGIILIQVTLIIHCLKTGQQQIWVWVLLFAPMIGGLAYFVMVLLPEIMGGQTARKIGEKIQEKRDPERALREARDALDHADTAHNRLRLADALLSRGDAREAAQLYEEALSGLFADDPAILFKLGHAKLEMNRGKEALDLFNRARDSSSTGLTPAQELLVARAYADSGQTHEALELLKGIVPRFAGEEARCFYAKTLAEAGQNAEAREVVREILKREERSPKHLRLAEKTWYDWARVQSF
jgi:hypothetical protein